VIQAGKNVLEFIVRGTELRVQCAKGGRQNCIQGEFVPVLDCAGEGVASVVCATAEVLVLEAVVAS